MTNYEWICKEYPEIIIDILSGNENSDEKGAGIALKKDNTVCLCKNISCEDCKFEHMGKINDEYKQCTEIIAEWLKQEHHELYMVSNNSELKDAFLDYLCNYSNKDLKNCYDEEIDNNVVLTYKVISNFFNTIIINKE